MGAEVARQAARLSVGNLSAALDLSAGESSDFGQLFVDWMRICYQGEGLKMSEWIEQATRLGRENQKNLLRYGLSLVRQSVLHRVGVPVQARGDELAFVTGFSTQLTQKRAEDLRSEKRRVGKAWVSTCSTR